MKFLSLNSSQKAETNLFGLKIESLIFFSSPCQKLERTIIIVIIGMLEYLKLHNFVLYNNDDKNSVMFKAE